MHSDMVLLLLLLLLYLLLLLLLGVLTITMNRKAVLLLLLCGLVCCNASYLSSLSNLYGRARSLLSGTSHVKAIALAGDFNVTLQALPSGLVLVSIPIKCC